MNTSSESGAEVATRVHFVILAVDYFDHVVSVDAFLGAARQLNTMFELAEFWPGFDDLPVRGPEGRFVHELTIPFTRHRAPTRRAPTPPITGRWSASSRRRRAGCISSSTPVR